MAPRMLVRRSSFVNDWARHFDAKVWFIQLADESSWPRCEIVTDVSDGDARWRTSSP